ncbi:luciferin 4-monooxygenase-like [Dermacentor variabilis]|uniref:luciferin 4-monooxygenase-like n=1 Tax=Dermacentor variabilis TaxID=34621 RepID=UPI003F5C2845
MTDLRHSFKFSPGDRENSIKAYFSVEDVPGFISISNLSRYNEEDYQEVRRFPGRVLVMASTSGTTGQSKIVQVTEERFLRKVCGMEATGLYSADDVCLACEYLNIYLSFSFNFKFICCGVRLVISDKYWSVDDFLSTAKNEKVSLLMTTPSVLYLLASAVAAMGARLPSLKKVISLGATLPKSTAGLVLSILKPTEFRNVYGLSEASGVVCCAPAGQLCFESVGFPVADTEVKILDPKTKRTMPPLEHGEIMVRSPNLMTSYYTNGEATAAAVGAEGWLRTGDMGYYDVSGRVFVTERLKSVIKCFDTKVEPFEVEQCVLELHFVAEVAVLGVAHPVLGEAPAAIVVLRRKLEQEKHGQIAQRIKEHVAERLAVYKGLHGGIVFAEKLPKNTRGKVLKRHLMTEFVKLKKAGAFY